MTTNHIATILVVDDEESDRKLLGAILATDDYKVLFSASGEEALASVAQQLPDLILLDVMLPGINGFEVTRRLRADKRSRMVPIIMATVLNDRASRLKALDAGASEFFSKPVDHAELLTRVKNQLRLKECSDLLADRNHALAQQNHELRLLNDVMMEREMRIIEIKREVNELLANTGQPPRYLSVTEPDE